jgi:hypothetical protein
MIVVTDREVSLPRGICPKPVKVRPADVTAVYFLRRHAVESLGAGAGRRARLQGDSVRAIGRVGGRSTPRRPRTARYRTDTLEKSAAS